jgi:glutamate carboxypeptidase
MNFPLYFRSRQGEMINFLKRMTELESPTSDKKAVDSCAAFVLKEFRKIGCRITTLPQKDVGDLHILEWGSLRRGEPEGEILVLAHLDTVWPVGTISRMPFYVSGTKIYGPGVLDMKGGLVMVFFALATLRSLNLRPANKITVFINSAEETGFRGAHELIRKLARKSSAVLCLEPAIPGGALKAERKGRLVVRLTVQGRSAHAGTPEKGTNACEELVAQLGKLRRIRTGETTLNIGCLHGGDKANVVPEKAWALLDIRFWKARDKNRILTALEEMKPTIKGARIKFAVENSTPPMERTKASLLLFDKAVRSAASVGMTLKAGKTGGGSDASIASGLGIPVLDGLGPDGNGIHAENEHLLLPSLVERTALLTVLLKDL